MIKRRVIQRHHISREPEIVRHVFRFEHEVLTKLDRLLKSTPSWTFLYELDKIRVEFRQRIASRCPFDESQMKILYEENQCRQAK
jgi:hypothetical protein